MLDTNICRTRTSMPDTSLCRTRTPTPGTNLCWTRTPMPDTSLFPTRMSMPDTRASVTTQTVANSFTPRTTNPAVITCSYLNQAALPRETSRLGLKNKVKAIGTTTTTTTTTPTMVTFRPKVIAKKITKVKDRLGSQLKDKVVAKVTTTEEKNTRHQRISPKTHDRRSSCQGRTPGRARSRTTTGCCEKRVSGCRRSETTPP